MPPRSMPARPGARRDPPAGVGPPADEVAKRAQKAPSAKRQAMGSRRFKTTVWTLVMRAILTGEPTDETRAALEELLRSYRAPLLSWVMEHLEPNRGRAEDLVHGFFRRIIERKIRASPRTSPRTSPLPSKRAAPTCSIFARTRHRPSTRASSPTRKAP